MSIQIHPSKEIRVLNIQKKVYNDSLNTYLKGFILAPVNCNPPKPTFNTSKYSFCSGDSLKLTVSNINKGDSIKWYYGLRRDLSNISTKYFKATCLVSF